MRLCITELSTFTIIVAENCSCIISAIDHRQAAISEVTENDKSRRLQISKSKTESLPNSISSTEKIPGKKYEPLINARQVKVE